jgi:putative FmdB family regulatory protein
LRQSASPGGLSAIEEESVPTYQYTCTECGEPLEVVQKFSDAALTDCPACSGRLRKVFSPVGIVFKGSGFYRTDSRTSSNGATTNGSKKPETTSESSESSEKKSEGASKESSSGSSSKDSSGSSSSSDSSGSGGSGGSTSSSKKAEAVA